MTVESATVGDVFSAYIEQLLSPKLRPDGVVEMDNLSAHKVDGIRQPIKACHDELFYGIHRP